MMDSSLGLSLLDVKRDIYKLHEKRRELEAPRAYIGGSFIGRECLRESYYKFRIPEPVDFYVTNLDREEGTGYGRTFRRFETGHREEDRIIAELKAAGYEIYDRTPSGAQFRVTALGGFFSGGLDFLWRIDSTNHVGEVKTMDKKNFNAVKKHGVQKKYQVYYDQVQSYMGLSKRFWDGWGVPGDPPEAAIFIFYCKDDERLGFEVVNFDPAAFKDIAKRAHGLLMSHEAPHKRARTADKFPCRFCSFTDYCHGVLLPTPVCKNCRFAEPNTETGKFSCAKHGHTFSLNGSMTATCDQHRYLSGILDEDVNSVDAWRESIELTENQEDELSFDME